MTWYRNGVEFTTEDIGDAIGMVYLITDTENGKMYVGKKNFWSVVTRPPLKGQKRKRKIKKESDWKDYWSSSEVLKSLVEEHGPERFRREVLHLCKAKGELSYMELHEQVKRGVLFNPDEYYNGIIQVRISRSHVKGMVQPS